MEAEQHSRVEPEPADGAAQARAGGVARLHDRRAHHFLRAAVVGLLAGTLAVFFRWSLFGGEALRNTALGWLHLHPAWGWSVLPAAGLLIGSFVGWITLRFAPDAPGSGIPHVKGVLLHVRTMKWWPLLGVKFVGGVLGIGCGLSLGREGPTVQMGAAVGQLVGRIIKVRNRSMPHLIACGAGAGLAAAFNAPLAGFIFVLEELRREMSPLTYGGALIAAVCSDMMTRTFTGQLPSFHVRGYAALPLGALPLVVLVGALTGLVGVAFNRGLLWATEFGLSVKRVPRWTLPGFALMGTGLLAWWLPNAVGGGHSTAEWLLSGQATQGAGGLTVAALAVLLLARFVATVGSYGSGAPGGIFAPMLIIGALVGLIVGQSAAHYFQSLHDPAAFAVLGMAAMFASSVRAPLTGIVLILEMTGNYEQLFGLAVACLVAYLIAESLRDRPIYDALLEEDLHRRAGTAAGDAEPVLLELAVEAGSPMDGRAIRELGLPKGCLVVDIQRAGQSVVPQGDTCVQEGDFVTILVSAQAAQETTKVERLARYQSSAAAPV